MTDRRSFLRTLPALGAAAAAPSLLAAEPLARADAAAPAHRGSVRTALEAIRITEVDVYTLEFPNPTPRSWNAIKTSGGKKPRVGVLEIQTDAGITGQVLTKGASSDIRSMARKLRGVNLLNVEQAWEHMYFHERKPVNKGKEIHAIGSVDLAVWDIVGKAMEQPVHRILGTFRERIPVYGAGGYYADGKGTAELVAEMEGYVAEGFDVVKMKVGGMSAREDAERVRAVVRALGSDARVMIDANNGYRTAYEAIRFGRMVEDLDLYWFEEPVAPYDWRGNAEVRDALDVPITAGENEYTRWGALNLLTNHSADILNLDTIKAGGITEMRKISALASAYHTPVAPHGYAHMNIHVLASLPGTLILETYPSKARDFNPALPPMPVSGGSVAAPTEPGLGMAIDPALMQYRVS